MMLDKRLLKAVPESMPFIIFTVALRFVSLLCNIITIFCVAHLIKTGGQEPVLPLAVLFFSALVAFLCSYFSSLTSFKASSGVKKKLRSMIYRKLLELGAEYQEKTETAKLIQLAVEGVEQLEVWFGLYVPQLFYSMIASITVFIVLAFLNLKMAVILLVCVPLIPVSIVIIQKIAKRILSKYWGQYAALADNFLENLQGLTTLEIYQADQDRQKKMNDEADHFRRVTMKVLSMQLNSIIVMDIVAYGGAGLGIAAAVNAFYSGALDLSGCFVCILLSADFFIPLRRLGSFFHTAMNGTTAANRIFEFLGEQNREGGSLPLAPAADASSATLSAGSDAPTSIALRGDSLQTVHWTVCLTLPTRNACLSLSGASYSFDGRTVLSGADILINEGEFAAFTGESGSGKSTAAKILCGINRNYCGSARLFGKEIKTIDRSELYEKVMYISHRDWIFKGTVRDTLLEGKNTASESEMLEALKKVQLLDFVSENGGLDFEISENAANLSGGQKQRLSIARALLHDSPVMIFDEASSNVDVESESAILELLHSLKGKKTILMISHRKENAEGADKIWHFENGKTEAAK